MGGSRSQLAYNFAPFYLPLFFIRSSKFPRLSGITALPATSGVADTYKVITGQPDHITSSRGIQNPS